MPLRVHNLYSDANGESHWRDIEVQWVEERNFSKLSARLPATGVIFSPMAHTYAFAIGGAIILALTLTPSLAAWFIRDRAKMEHGHAPGGQDGGWLLTRALTSQQGLR